MSNLRTPLSQARGHGASGSGTSHFWLQRLTSVALVPLVVWFAFAVATLATLDHAGITAFLSSTYNAALMIASLVAVFIHAALGLQVVIEDYIADQAMRLGLVIATKLLAALFAIIGIVAVIKIAIGS